MEDGEFILQGWTEICLLTQEKQPAEEVMVVINRCAGDISMKEDETT